MRHKKQGMLKFGFLKLHLLLTLLRFSINYIGSFINDLRCPQSIS